jgi:hypothetical protein
MDGKTDRPGIASCEKDNDDHHADGQPFVDDAPPVVTRAGGRIGLYSADKLLVSVATGEWLYNNDDRHQLRCEVFGCQNHWLLTLDPDCHVALSL